MLAVVLLLGVLPLILDLRPALGEIATGPLQVSKCNPRYFSDEKGRIVYLTGSHTWTNFQDDPTDPAFDFEGYLTLLERHHHNFIRLWMLESASWEAGDGQLLGRDPLPYLRSAAEKARDGLPKFDLRSFNPRYFERLRQRVAAARDRGIYVGVMLFNGWSIERKYSDRRSWMQRAIANVYQAIGIEPPPWDRTNPWHSHPFNRANNVNGVDGDADHDGEGLEVHTLDNREVTTFQERYVQKVIDTLNDLDNVLYEISNESRGESSDWQYHMIRFIHQYEATKPKQHPVLMTWQDPGGTNESLYRSPAEAVSPGSDPGDLVYRTNLPAADGSKVIISDTDHIWGLGGDPEWVWRSLMRGHQPIFMERLAEVGHHAEGDIPLSDEIRKTMGQTRWFSERINLARMTPRNDLCSTTYCLADPDHEYLIYLPGGESVTVSLGTAAGPFSIEWFNPDDGRGLRGGSVGGGSQELHSPFAGHSVVHIKAFKAIKEAMTLQKQHQSCQSH